MSANANLILIGPMGAGKTTHGKLLARQLGRRFVDLDAHIEQHTGTSISHIFDLEGEAGFRRRESEALAEVPPEQQLQRLAGDRKRPLLQCADRAGRLQQLSEIRTPLYRACADIHIDLSRMPMTKVRHHLIECLNERAEGAEPHFFSDAPPAEIYTLSLQRSSHLG